MSDLVNAEQVGRWMLQASNMAEGRDIQWDDLYEIDRTLILYVAEHVLERLYDSIC